MSDIEIDVDLVEATIEVAPVSVTIEATPVTAEIAITPPDLIELDVTPPPVVDLAITTVDANVTVIAPPVVNFNVGGLGSGDGECHVPPGGATNAVLAKKSNFDFDLKWTGGGNKTYYIPVDEVPSDEDLVEGDLLIDGDDSNATYRWDGVQWVDVHNLNIDEISDGVNTNSDQITLINQSLDELQVHVSDVEKTSNSNDGRVTFSDYIPTPDDVYFPVISTDPDTGDNVVTYIPRVEGSVWFQRTRPRRNLLLNPSFEKNDHTWQASGCTFVRVDPPDDVPDVAGHYCLQVTSLPGGNAAVEPTYPFEASDSKWYTGSAHMMLVTGSGVGCFATLAFYDVDDVLLLSVQGEIEDLVQAPPDAEHWNRINVLAQAPIGTTYCRFAMHNPNPSDVWYMGAAIFENLDELGKYFDGDSYDGYWEGGTGDPSTNPDENPQEGDVGWQESTSRLYGNKIIGVWELHAENWIRKFFTEDTLDQIDASKINNLEHFTLADNTVAIDKMWVPRVLAIEDLTKGDIVNVYSAAGIPRVRRASAALGYGAAGFILEDVATNAPVHVYSFGANPFQPDMLPGPKWLSETAGRVSDTPPSTIGCIVQRVGYAVDSLVLDFHPLLPIKLV